MFAITIASFGFVVPIQLICDTTSPNEAVNKDLIRMFNRVHRYLIINYFDLILVCSILKTRNWGGNNLNEWRDGDVGMSGKC